MRAAGEGATFAARGDQLSGCVMGREMERRAGWGQHWGMGAKGD